MDGVKVYSKQLLGDLIKDGCNGGEKFEYDPEDLKRIAKPCRKLDPVEQKKILRNKAYWARMNKVQEESERQVREKLEHIRAKKEQRFQHLTQSIENGDEYLREVDNMLDFHDKMEQRKQLARYNEWNEEVYGRIQRKIKESSEKDAKRLRKLRQQEYGNFLKETNEKNSLFLDIVIASSYDPFTVNRNGIRCKMGELDDPTQRAVRKYEMEQNMVPSLDGRDKGPDYVRGMLPVNMWASGRIESTPHGYFAKLMQERDGGARERAELRNGSRVTMDHFDFPREKGSADSEFPRGKRTDFSHLKHQPRRDSAGIL